MLRVHSFVLCALLVARAVFVTKRLLLLFIHVMCLGISVSGKLYTIGGMKFIRVGLFWILVCITGNGEFPL